MTFACLHQVWTHAVYGQTDMEVEMVIHIEISISLKIVVNELQLPLRFAAALRKFSRDLWLVMFLYSLPPLFSRFSPSHPL